MTESTRLNKRLVELGLATSRRSADALIAAGLVKVNAIATTSLATRIKADDHITVAGKSGKIRPHLTIAFNKPTGYICSHVTQGDTPTIFALLPKNFASLKIVGRLDKDSEGLMLLTSDGALVNHYSHPSNHQTKEYLVTTKQSINEQTLGVLKKPMTLDDRAVNFQTIRRINAHTIKIVLGEGRNRQIRRMLAQNELEVVRLQRIRIGDYQLGRLALGKYEFVSDAK